VLKDQNSKTDKSYCELEGKWVETVGWKGILKVGSVKNAVEARKHRKWFRLEKQLGTYNLSPLLGIWTGHSF
jgi:hypothetical protein